MRYQIHVTDAGKDLAVGPIVEARKFLEPLAAAINTNVSRGVERNWRDARIVSVQDIPRNIQ